ncbi:MAG: discoidin domain-containing protein, partial [Deltaproteobacteria bacterium]|nr:discoidin domain-containing protein [Deltaproteobacteria bacterium]
PEQAPLLLDGRQDTRWESETVQRPDQWVALDLGQAQRVAGLRLALGAEVLAYPRALRVEASLNGSSWQTAMEPIEPVPPLIAYARRPRPLTLVVLFPELRTRWVRLTQLGQAPARPWGMAEIELLPPFAASPAPCGPGPGWIGD